MIILASCDENNAADVNFCSVIKLVSSPKVDFAIQ